MQAYPSVQVPGQHLPARADADNYPRMRRELCPPFLAGRRAERDTRPKEGDTYTRITNHRRGGGDVITGTTWSLMIHRNELKACERSKLDGDRSPNQRPRKRQGCFGPEGSAGCLSCRPRRESFKYLMKCSFVRTYAAHAAAEELTQVSLIDSRAAWWSVRV
jgi:hypothetical protein